LNYKLIFIPILISFINADISESSYLWPTNKSNEITTLFGERRSRRFHAGIDVRTYGKIGDKIFAVESGYISRIKISSDGYGKAIYIKLNDGNTILYAHLDRFNNTIEKIAQNIQVTQKNSFIDQYFNKNKFKVKRGDVIGYCGDSGSLSGPHLHFEIRDEIGNPLNPLKYYYFLPDTLKPIAKSLAFIPLDKNCFINGKQNYEIINLKPLKYDGMSSVYKYFLQDTVSIIGNFGVAINVYDKMDLSPFKFGIYEIEMLIDNNEVYKINFDKYNFTHDPLIYTEIDYNLYTKYSENFHRLFINNNSRLEFIKPGSNKSLNLDKNFHNLIINISDNFNNKIQVQGIIKGNIAMSPKAIFNLELLSLEFEEPLQNINFNLSTRYKDSRKIPVSYTMFDSIYYQFEMPERPYETLEYFIKKDGMKSKSKYISLFNYDPYKINGEFLIEHLDNNIIINFIEDLFSGYQADLIIEYNNHTKKIFNLYRHEKHILSSGLLDLNDMSNINKIYIKYKTNPEIIFSETIKGHIFDEKKINHYTFNKFSLTTKEQSFYNNIFIWNEKINIDIPNTYNIIHSPINLMPHNIPFQKKIILSYLNNNSGSIYQYNKENNKWIYIQSEKTDSLSSKITSGGIFAILDEKINPKISSIFPNHNSIYSFDDINSVSFNIIDNESGINLDSIDISLNNKKIYHEYISYRNLVRSNINNELIIGKNSLDIFCKDNANNDLNIKTIFYIE